MRARHPECRIVKEIIDERASDEALERIRAVTDLDAAVAGSQLIIEAVPEKLELKQEVFKELDGIIKPEAIFASNTSGFVIAEIASEVSDDRKPLCCGMHYSNPVPVMRMLEVIYTPETSQDTIEAAAGVGEKSQRAVSLVDVRIVPR